MHQDDQRRLCLYAALFLPFRNTIYKDHKAKKIPVVSYIFRNSLKLKASDSETVTSLHSVTQKLVSLIPFITSKDIEIIEVDWKTDTIDVPVASKRRILIGLLLREIKEFWRVSLVLSMLLYPTNVDTEENIELEKRSKLFKTIENDILNLGLESVWEAKPLVNGKEIMNILQIKTGGPIVKEWQQKLLEWQLAHPSGTAEECTDWMKEANSKRARTE
nr:putative CCA tRNA nucleotidyltransferase 2 [Ipomoea batatas]